MNPLKYAANSLYLSLDFQRETLFKKVRNHCYRALSCLSIFPLKEEEKLLGKEPSVDSRTVTVDQESYM